MSIGRQTRHFEREQVVDVIREALEVTEELEPPAELREEVFRSAVQLASKVYVEVVRPGGGLELGRH